MTMIRAADDQLAPLQQVWEQLNKTAGPELAAQIQSHRSQLERTLALVDRLTAAAQADRSLLAPRLDEAARGRRMQAAYAASKAGLMTMAKSIANEYARFGVTANALAPTLIDTDMIAEQRDLVSRIPVGRFGKPEEVAALVAFLASEHAGYITGEVTDINGGFLVD